MNAEWLSAWAAAANVVLTLALVVAAGLSLRAALRTLRASQEASVAARVASDAAQVANEQAERDSIERTRPYVFTEIMPGLSSIHAYDLVIRNTGASVARSVRLTFDSWPTETDDIGDRIRELLTTPRDLPPGSSIRVIWHLKANGKFTDGTTEAGMPLAGKLTVSYESDEPKRGTYVDNYPFDVAKAGLWPVPGTGPNPDGLHGTARLFYLALQRLSHHVAELRR